ncbi:polysaccharide export protein [Aidingimonas lacisalsi]|uniref:polysaccharide export protein n=1 Tax=Aidingimonas lacisalsi TaxID=2604086 RepID=UPI0011D2590E|nr:polysaccharide export protein [Aidingimonas lacisalsi]
MLMQGGRHWLGVIALSAGISGCAMAPGGHIDYETESVSLDGLVDIEPITPELVSEYRARLNGSIASPISPALSAAVTEYEYLVGPGDILSIVVYDHPELTIPAGGERSAAEAGNVVHPDGTLFYPYIGRVEVEGMTVEAVRDLLTRRLSEYINDPQIEVTVADYRAKKVYVSGAVGSPGTIPITNVPLTAMDAISLSGGISGEGNWHEVTLTRDDEEEVLSLYDMMQRGDRTQNRLLQDGDILHVPTRENQNVAVLGQVRAPGNLNLGNERITLTDALARAGGVVEERAEPTGIFVIRTHRDASDKVATVYQLDISNAVALAMGTRFPLEPQDIIYVTSAPLARWNTVISLLLPSVNLPGSVVNTTTDVNDL